MVWPESCSKSVAFPLRPPAACHNKPAGMHRFAETGDAVAQNPKKNEKVRLVGEYLRSLPTEDAARAAVFFTGRAFPRCEEKVLAVGGSLIWQAVRKVAATDTAAMETVYRKHGDLGGMAEELLAGKTTAEGLPLSAVADGFEALARCRVAAQKLALLEDLSRRLHPVEAKYVAKIVTGDLRIGLKETRFRLWSG